MCYGGAAALGYTHLDVVVTRGEVGAAAVKISRTSMSTYIDAGGRLHHDQEANLALTCPHCQVLSHITPIAVPSFDELVSHRPKQVGVVYRCDACNAAIFLRFPVRMFGNNRIEQLAISVNGGPPQLVGLPDEYISWTPDSWKAYQLIQLAPYSGDAKTITLTVKQVYRGSRYDDTCISEVLLRKRLPEKPQVKGAR